MHELVAVLQSVADPAAAEVMARYFQVRPGGYGEGDIFLGIKMGPLRSIAKPYVGTAFVDGQWLELLRSPVHEHRMITLIVMSERAKRLGRRPSADTDEFAHLYATYLANTDRINNWDLVDVSSGPVVGGYLLTRDRAVLYEAARSPVLWERRIAMVSTQHFIGAGQSADVYALAALLLDDPHDLMHKAVGWMLREAGKRVDSDELRRFLDQHANRMSRTALRYAVERFDRAERKSYLSVPQASGQVRSLAAGSSPGPG